MKLFYFNEKEKPSFQIKNIKNNFLENICGRGKVGIKSISFPSAFKTGIKENDEAFFEFFDCRVDKESDKKNSRKCIILLHGFKSRKEKLSPYYCFIDEALKKGYCCALMHLPFHLKRTPIGQSSKEILLNMDDIGITEFFHQSVLDIAKLIKILKTGLNIDKAYLLGLSLGGMVSVFAKAWLEDIEKTALLICGGNWHEIYWNSLISKILLKGKYIKKNKILRQQSEDFYMRLPEFINVLKENLKGPFETEMYDDPVFSTYLSAKWFLCDPCTFAHKILKEESLMIEAKIDFLFNKKSVNCLWEQLSKPRIKWVNKLHTSRILKNKSVSEDIFDFFEN